jgi:hypothetical protein
VFEVATTWDVSNSSVSLGLATRGQRVTKKKAVQFEFHKGTAKLGLLEPRPFTEAHAAKGVTEFAVGEHPDHMKDDAGKGTENLRPEDTLWTVPGDDGESPVRLPKEGYEQ